MRGKGDDKQIGNKIKEEDKREVGGKFTKEDAGKVEMIRKRYRGEEKGGKQEGKREDDAEK